LAKASKASNNNKPIDPNAPAYRVSPIAIRAN